MMRIGLGLTVILLCGFARPASATRIDSWRDGLVTPPYHRISATCEALSHSHGRNAAWGRWSMAPAEVKVSVEGQRLDFVCRDGLACIRSGLLDRDTGRVSRHSLTFRSEADAAAMGSRIESLQAACIA